MRSIHRHWTTQRLLTGVFGILILGGVAFGGPSWRADLDTGLELTKEEAGLESPAAIFYDAKADELYVGDLKQNAVVVFGPEGRERTRFLSDTPTSMDADSNGMLYVVSQRGEISTYDFRGESRGVLEINELPEPAGKVHARCIAVDKNDDLYIGDVGNKVVLVTDPEGNFQRALGVFGEDEKGIRFTSIKDIAVGRRRVYVLDQGSTIYVFSRSSGNFLFKFGEPGGAVGQLAMPVSIAVDDENSAYVLDTKRHCISVYDEEGNYVGEAGGQGKSKGWLYYPRTLRTTGDGLFFVTETVQSRVQRFKIRRREQEGAEKGEEEEKEK